MANPLLIPIAFATNGAKNIIQKIRQAGQGEDAATWDGGWSGRTMIPKDAGGLPPDGRDFNGLFNVVSEHLIHRQDGEQIKFDPVKVAEIGGYPKGALIQSDDTETTYRSLIDNNTFNPNTQPIANRWEIYAGKGSIPIATSTTAGIMQVKNNLVSTDTAAALSALQGKILNEKINSFAHPVAMGKCVFNGNWDNPVYTLVNGFNVKHIQGRRFLGGFAEGRLVIEFDKPMKNANYIVQATTARHGFDPSASSVTVENIAGGDFPPTRNNFSLSFNYGGDNTRGYFFPSIFYFVVYA